MGSTSEVITLQFGHYSNFIGAHWWNLQEANFIYSGKTAPEINYDVLFREGETNQRETTFTPRLLLVDLKGSLHTLSENSILYDGCNTVAAKVDPSDLLWSAEKVDTQVSAKYKKNEFLEDIERSDQEIIYDNNGVSAVKSATLKKYNLDDQVEVWSDYLSTVFHSRTINIINEYTHNDENRAFNIFNQGSEIWKTEQFTENWSDNCRAYAEECDSLQGFQLLFDCYNGFGGLACSALEHIKDEYSTKSCLVFPAIHSDFQNSSISSNSIHTINSALSFSGLIDASSVFVPLCTGSGDWYASGNQRQYPYLNYNNQLPYHSSAILAAFLDTATLRYRKRDSNVCMANMCSTLSPVGRILLASSVKLPVPIDFNSSLLEFFENYEGPMWTSVSPYCEPELDSAAVHDFVLRGLSPLSLYPSDIKKRKTNRSFDCQNIQELYTLFLDFKSSTHISAMVDSFAAPLRTCPSFPHIFNENISRNGFLSKDTRTLNQCVEQIPLISGLHNCSSSGRMLLSLYEEAKKLHLRNFPQFTALGFEQLEYSESLEKLISLSECYE